MNKTFIESAQFTEWFKKYLEDDQLAAIQHELLVNPARGDVIPGCGGLRKLRIANSKRGKGKRSGCRVIYLHVAEVDVIYLLDIYGKDEQDDLSAAQKKKLKELADAYKVAAILAAKHSRKDYHEFN